VELNNILDRSELLWKNRRLIKGPEALAVDPEGQYMYFGTHDGRLVRINIHRPRSSQPEYVGTIGNPNDVLPLPCGTYFTVPVCGRPLGMKFHKNGKLYFIDAFFGAFSYDRIRHRVEKLVSPVTDKLGKPMLFPNDIAVASNGKIYITVSSDKYRLNDLYLEVLESRANGFIVEYSPRNRKSRIISQDLYFPNGILVDPTDSYLLVAETSRARITKVELAATVAGDKTIVLDNLPYLPDNMAYVGKELWVAGSHVRVAGTFSMFDWLADKPWLRKIIAKAIPPRLQGMLSYLDSSSGVMRVQVNDEPVYYGNDAKPLHDDDDPDDLITSASLVGTLGSQGKVKWLSHVSYHDGYIYLGSYHEDVHAIARLAWDLDKMEPVGGVGKWRKLRREEVVRQREENKARGVKEDL
jgi:sugar lactone lactonase YvrE